MPLTDSRLGVGTLLFGTQDVSFQASNVVLSPDVSEDDGTATLAEPEPPPLATVAWSLKGTVIQDFSAGGESFVNWCSDNSLTDSPFTFTPNTDAGVVYAGTVQVRPVEIGGDAGTQVTTDFEMPVIGPITRTDPDGASTELGGRRGKHPASSAAS